MRFQKTFKYSPTLTLHDSGCQDNGRLYAGRGFWNIGTESPVQSSSATIAAMYELFLVNNRIAQWPQFAPRYGFGHRE
jgi:hypothetical protein